MASPPLAQLWLLAAARHVVRSPTLGPGISWAGHHDRRTVAERQKGAPHVLSASHRMRRRYRGIVARVMTSECPRRLPAGAQAWLRPTRHPVQTPARRCHGGVTSRRVDAVVSQPRSTPPSPQLDVAGTLGEGLPRRFRDTDDRSGVRRQNVRGTLFSSATILDRGKRLRIHRGRASASSHRRGRAPASSRPRPCPQRALRAPRDDRAARNPDQPKLIFASRLVRESALTSASSSVTLPSSRAGRARRRSSACPSRCCAPALP